MFQSLRIDDVAFLVPLYGLAALLAAALLVGRRPLRRAAAATAGGALGFIVLWIMTDVLNVFGMPLTAITTMWIVLACAGVALALAGIATRRRWRAAVAVLAIPVFLVMAGAGVNVDFGAYRTASDALQLTPKVPIPGLLLAGTATAEPPSPATWHAPSGMPAHGMVGTAQIPGTVSGFHARAASLYLPPAALVADPPTLPVVVAFSGQPGSPADMFASGRIAGTLDEYAAHHDGLAPIVVVPDQLGAPGRNPMCVDSTLGDSASYVTIDVVNWIKAHLRVPRDPRYWAVAGYSQGGTCAIQFGSEHPELFRSILDISGEDAPTIGAGTVTTAFGGSAAAYDAAKPVDVLSRDAPYRDTTAIFGVGSRDRTFAPQVNEVMTAAGAAGMRTRLVDSPGTGHDWNTVRYVLSRALPQLADRMGLALSPIPPG